jgi:hypothetical protein
MIGANGLIYLEIIQVSLNIQMKLNIGILMAKYID